jgi:hypothetical protein
MSNRDLEKLRNIGPQSAAWLLEVGIATPDDLARLGPLEACRRLILQGRRITLNMAYALEGALLDCDWRSLPEENRLRLEQEFRRLGA